MFEASALANLKATTDKSPDSYNAAGTPFRTATKIINGHHVQGRWTMGQDAIYFVDKAGPYTENEAITLIEK